MRVLVTGALGKVGAATVWALLEQGHEVTGCDLRPPVFEVAARPDAAYVQADLADAGDAYAVVRGHDAVIHAAAFPAPVNTPPHRTFENNVLAAFNVIEAAVRLEVPRLVNVSSETVPGFVFNERPDRPDSFPVDEGHEVRAQDPYALAKSFAEQLCDAAVRRSDLRCVTVRPSWVQWEGNYERNLGPVLRDPTAEASPSGWGYVDVHDLADALLLAMQADVDAHEVCNVAAADNSGGRPLEELVRATWGPELEVGELERPDASGQSIAKARALLGYAPTRSWRDVLDPASGALLPEPAARLAAGETAVQRGRAALS